MYEGFPVITLALCHMLDDSYTLHGSCRACGKSKKIDLRDACERLGRDHEPNIREGCDAIADRGLSIFLLADRTERNREIEMSDEKTDTRPASPINAEHWYDHPGCLNWGSFGKDRSRNGQVNTAQLILLRVSNNDRRATNNRSKTLRIQFL